MNEQTIETIQKAKTVKTPKVVVPLTPEEVAKKAEQVAARKILASLRNRTATEWNGLVRGIVDPAVQVKVANIIWFDYFSPRDNTERWPELDDLVALWHPTQFKEPPMEEVEKALIGIGFPADLAKKRTHTMEYFDETAPAEEPDLKLEGTESPLGERPNILEIFKFAMKPVLDADPITADGDNE